MWDFFLPSVFASSVTKCRLIFHCPVRRRRPRCIRIAAIRHPHHLKSRPAARSCPPSPFSVNTANSFPFSGKVTWKCDVVVFLPVYRPSISGRPLFSKETGGLPHMAVLHIRTHAHTSPCIVLRSEIDFAHHQRSEVAV